MTVDAEFAPCAVDEDDELFANGIFVFNITKMLDYIALQPDAVEMVDVSVDDFYEGFSSLNEAHVQSVDVNRPVLLGEISPGHYNLIDGNHRVAKAARQGLKTLRAYRLNAPHHVPFLVSRDAYVKYVEYWNEKLAE